MSKVFKVTQSNQYIQTVALSKGDYVFQCNVKHHKDVLTIALKDGSNVWYEYEVPCKKNTWVDKAQLKFTTTVDMTAFSLCYKDASTQKPVYIEKPVLKMGAEIGIISPNYKDLIEELESSLVINNGEGSLLNGLLDITELTNDKGSANLSLDVGKSILRKNVSLVKNKEGKDGEQGNTPYIEDGYWFIDGQPTGIKAEGEDGAEGVSPHIGSNGNWYVGTVDTGIKAKGDKGDTGLAGQIPIQKEWVVGDVHRNTDEIVDYIYVRGANKAQSYWYKLSAKGTVTAGAPPTGGTTPSGYEKINWLKALAVNVLLAEEANVAGFIFKGNQLISERGTVDGVSVNYGDNLTLEEREAFIPNLILDGTEGDVKITGTVNAKSGSIGVLTVDTSGQVKLEDPDTGSKRLSFIKSKIPLLADLLGSTNFGDSVTNSTNSLVAPSSGTITSYLSGTLNVEKNGSVIDITGGAFFNLDGLINDSGVSITASLDLMRNDVKYQTLESSVLAFGMDGVPGTVRDHKLTGLPSGTYRLRLSIRKLGVGGNSSAMVVVGSIPMSWSFQQSGVRNFLFGLNGFLSFFSDRHIYFSEESGFDLKGPTNMPGVLLSTTVSTNGAFSNFWGAKRHASLSAVKASTGTYDIYHAIGHTNYSISANAYGNRTISLVSKSTDRCRVQIYNGTTLIDSQFDITLTGNNY